MFQTYKILFLIVAIASSGFSSATAAYAEMPAGRCMYTEDCNDADPCSIDVCTNGDESCGDANDDGTLSAPDALLICRAAVFLEDCGAKCDLDGNGVVTASDALVLMNFIVGIPAVMVCMGQCDTLSACDDADECTADTCDQGHCSNDPMPAGYGLDVIDFEGLAGGTIPDEVTSADGATIGIHGLNPNFGPGVNAAVIFDSACSSGTCTGGDSDLGTPNEDFGGPGIGSGGASGASGENADALGGLLIVSATLEDGNGDDLVDDPGDLSFEIVMLELDFSSLGGISLHELTIVDVETNELTPNVKLYDGSGGLMKTVNLPATGNNGVRVVRMPENYGVYKAVVTLRGSGAIDNVAFSTDGVCLW
jgi:hypothetical protein